uniref:Synaptopodin 2b n=1 Tax=Esox lucius TaxID=8010 RepID=A0AAY5K071_ESOLU
MEPEAENQESSVIDAWSGSESRHSSDELYLSESMDGSYYEERTTDTVPIDSWSSHITHVDYPHSVDHPDLYAQRVMVKHQTPPSNSSPEQTSAVRELRPCRSEEIDNLSQEPGNVYPGESMESYTSTHLPSLSKSPQGPDPNSGQISRQRSTSSSSIGQGEMTQAPTHEKPSGNDRRLGFGTEARGNGCVESPEEGGHSEAPPAYVSFGISEQGAEQAEWDSASERDIPSPSRHRARRTRPSHNESQSERQVKEAKSKCKRIALLLTDAPNPRNRGVLMFKKRRQRVKKYTLISYGTGQQQFDNKSDEEVISEDGQTARFPYAASDYSELQEDYSVNVKNRDVNLNWDNLGIPTISQHLKEMDQLPETKGKGVAMFAQRRQRMDEIALEQEEMKRKGLPAEGMVEPVDAETYKSYVQSNQIQSSEGPDHMDQHLRYQENHQQEMQEYAEMINNLPNHQANAISKPLVPNRTAKPFLGFQNRGPVPYSPLSGVTSTVRHHELKFKVPVPIHTVPQVWSPTGDIIASRDERISVPAIKTGILPDSKRRGANRTVMGSAQQSNTYIQNKGERKSYIESGEEEDYFSLGAEACNFMQPRTIKHKNPPPVAPKPNINLACPPWLKESSSNAQFHPAKTRPQPPINTWTPANTTSASQLKPTMNSWSPQPPRSPVSIQALNPTYTATHQPTGHVSLSGDGPTLKGRGAELFAKRQTRMEKFVVDAETVQANKAKSSSPTVSLPGTWRYSPNVRAPPPLSYNPLHAHFYPPTAAKQPPSTSPKPKPKTKAQAKVPLPKHLDSLDVMKHHPYQLDSSLFTYNEATEAEACSPQPKRSPILTPELYPPSSPRPAPIVNPKPAPVTTPYSTHDLPSANQQTKPIAPAKGTIPMAPRPKFSAKKQEGLGRSFSLSLHRPKPSQLSMSHVTTPVFQPSLGRQTSWQEKAVLKPPSPWEAASRSPLGLVDDAFRFQNVSQSIATNVNAAANRRSLPEPPEEWKQKVSLDISSVSGGYYHAPPPTMHTRSMSMTSAPVCGPPFRQAQPLWSGVSTNMGHMGQGPPLYATFPRSAVRR